MESARRFCRFNPDPSHSIAISQIPPGGFCLNAFLVLSPADDPHSVLLGRIDPAAPWDRIGALDAKRVASIGNRWTLPSSQLLYGEGPADAARRVAAEQLGWSEYSPAAPEVFSEVYGGPNRPPGNEHWDVHFVFRGSLPRALPPSAPGYLELAWHDPATTPVASFARSHQDILVLAGLRPAGV